MQGLKCHSAEQVARMVAESDLTHFGSYVVPCGVISTMAMGHLSYSQWPRFSETNDAVEAELYKHFKGRCNP